MLKPLGLATLTESLVSGGGGGGGDGGDGYFRNVVVTDHFGNIYRAGMNCENQLIG